jgi:ATPase subunit of ABC transporter with duplicated ATPase domains
VWRVFRESDGPIHCSHISHLTLHLFILDGIIAILVPDVSVADALLGIRGDERDATGSNNNKSVYATVRRFRLAAELAESNRTYAMQTRKAPHTVWLDSYVLSLSNSSTAEAFSLASAAMDAVDGWNVLTKAEEVATKLRVRHLQDQPLANLSGGERKRVALAAALVQDPSVLLLDEPTNFLSLAGVQWLSDLLKDNKKLTILMVTHDRAFLDDVCDRIVELDQGKLVRVAHD